MKLDVSPVPDETKQQGNKGGGEVRRVLETGRGCAQQAGLGNEAGLNQRRKYSTRKKGCQQTQIFPSWLIARLPLPFNIRQL